jgi:hypothetical protein
MWPDFRLIAHPGTLSASACIAVSCAAGALFGLLYLPEPRAIDGALVLAGLVSYPAGSAQGIYFHNMWSAAHQVLAAMLWSGIPQILVTWIFCAALGASLVAGPALVSLALTGRAALSLLLALLIVGSSFFVRGTDYGIRFVSSHSYGQIASSLTILSLGLFGCRRYASAGFVAGVLPAFHAVVGCWTLGLILLGGLFLPGRFGVDRLRLFRGLAAGLAVSAVSFAWYWADRNSTPIAVDTTALAEFIQYWDRHRSTPYAYRTAVLSIVSAALLWIAFDHGRRSRNLSLVQISFLLLASTLGSWMIYEAVHRLDWLPAIVYRAMPGRLVNFHYTLALPIVIGAFLTPRKFTALVLSVPLVLASPLSRSTKAALLAGAASVAAYLLWTLWRARAKRATETAGHHSMPTPLTALACAAGVALVAHGLVNLWVRTTPECSNTVLDYCRPPAFFREIRDLKWQGLTAAPAGLALMTHRHARKAVLLGASGMDFVPYLPQTARQVRDIVESVYGVDFRRPPPEFKNKGHIVRKMGQEHWAALSAQEWAALALRFCLGAVIAPADWEIQLTPAREADGVRLYLLPDQTLEACQIS